MNPWRKSCNVFRIKKSCTEDFCWMNEWNIMSNLSKNLNTHVNVETNKLEYFACWQFAGWIAIEFMISTVKLYRIQWCTIQIIRAYECGMLTATHWRWIHLKTNITYRRWWQTCKIKRIQTLLLNKSFFLLCTQLCSLMMIQFKMQTKIFGFVGLIKSFGLFVWII